MTTRVTPKRARNESTTLYRLSQASLWGRELAIIGFILNALLSLLMDVLRLNSPTWMWLVPSLGSYVFAFGVGWVAGKLVKPFAGNPRLWMLNIFFAAVVGATKNVVVGLLAAQLGLADDATWGFRFVGGAMMGIALVVYVSIATGARIDHRDAVRKLYALRSQLLKNRQNLQQVVESENNKLVHTTNEVLVPKLRRIEELLREHESLKSVIDEIRATIETDLRPLTKLVTAESIDKIQIPSAIAEVKITEAKLPTKASTSNLLRPGRTFFFNMFTALIFMFFFMGPIGLLYAAVTVSIEALLHLVVKKLLPQRLIPLRQALLQLAAISLLGSMPLVGVVVWKLSESSQFLVALIVSIVISTFGAISSGYALMLDDERERVEAEIEGDNKSLAHDISIYEQKIWVFRKAWQLLLHGTVQAALTAALTRLSVNYDDDSVRLELVRQDLKRAEAALQAKPVREIDLQKAIGELTAAWQGICKVCVTVSERANRALKRNFEALFGVNEIMREAVSNSVRHGAATEVKIEIDRVEDAIIEFTSQNNGIALSDQGEAGLGSQMMSELTIEWSLETEQRSGLTVLTARIPVSL